MDKRDRRGCCCPSCKREAGIKVSGEASSQVAECKFCEWRGTPDDLLCDSDDYKYHDHEPGID